MDDKTEELRDIFMDVAEDKTVTESQADDRGTLLDRADVNDRLLSVIERMRDEFDFRTDLPNDDLCRVVAGFYDGATDTEIARELDVARSTVQRARLDLHLIRDRDTDAPFDLDALRSAITGNDPGTAALAERFGVSPSTLRRYRRVVHAQARSRRVTERFRDQFDEILADADLTERVADRVREDGLDDATEGMENDLQF